MDRGKIHGPRIAWVAHVGDHHAATSRCADRGLAAIDHDLYAVAAPALSMYPTNVMLRTPSGVIMPLPLFAFGAITLTNTRKRGIDAWFPEPTHR